MADTETGARRELSRLFAVRSTDGQDDAVAELQCAISRLAVVGGAGGGAEQTGSAERADNGPRQDFCPALLNTPTGE